MDKIKMVRLRIRVRVRVISPLLIEDNTVFMGIFKVDQVRSYCT
jgi:hypothetical protein